MKQDKFTHAIKITFNNNIHDKTKLTLEHSHSDTENALNGKTFNQLIINCFCGVELSLFVSLFLPLIMFTIFSHIYPL